MNAGAVYGMIWVCGFAGILAIIGILQTLKRMEGEDVAPPRVWKWMVFFAAIWPLFAVLFIVVGLITLLFPNLTRMPKTPPIPAAMAKRKYAFTVKARDETWDCYHFESTDGKSGTLGFTKRGENFVIGLMCAGHLTKDQAQKQLDEAIEKESN